MNKEDTMALISAAIQSLMYGGDHGAWKDANYAWINDADNGIGDRISRLEKAPAVVSELQDALWSYHFGGDRGRWTHQNYPSLIGDPSHGVDDRLRRVEGAP